MKYLLTRFIAGRGISILLIPIMHVVTGCNQEAQDYFPLGRGRVLEYSIEHRINDERHQAKLLIADLPAIRMDGETYYPRRTGSGMMYYVHKTSRGIYYSTEPNLSGRIILKYPLGLTTRWQSESDVYILKNRHESFAGGESFISLGDTVMLDYRVAKLDETVQVPAGDYTGCVRIEAYGSMRVKERTRGIEMINIDQTEWYSPEAGLVKMIRKEYTIPDKIRGEMVQELIETRSE
jgi:hypothetical protein